MTAKRPKGLAKELKIYCQEKHLKHHELARLLSTTETNISRWLSGKHKISPAWEKLIRQTVQFNSATENEDQGE